MPKNVFVRKSMGQLVVFESLNVSCFLLINMRWTYQLGPPVQDPGPDSDFWSVDYLGLWAKALWIIQEWPMGLQWVHV